MSDYNWAEILDSEKDRNKRAAGFSYVKMHCNDLIF